MSTKLSDPNGRPVRVALRMADPYLDIFELGMDSLLNISNGKFNAWAIASMVSGLPCLIPFSIKDLAELLTPTW